MLLAFHILSVVIWVGGMFFAYMCLRPVAVQLLEAPLRSKLWDGVLQRFFRWVWKAVVVLPVTGFILGYQMFGGMGQWPIYVHIMLALGIIMLMIFFHVYFAPYKRLREAVSINDSQVAAENVGKLRKLVGLNLLIGLILIVVAVIGRTVSV